MLGVKDITDAHESEVDDILLLKFVKSAEVRRPRLVSEADGMLNAMVWPLPVMVKSLPVVDVAKSTEPEDTCCPSGPTAEMSELAEGKHVPLIEKQPVVMLTPLLAVVEPVKVSAPWTRRG